jgi:hypothetical protein
VFQRFISHIFADIPQVFVYIDDFLVVESDPDRHIKLLRIIFQRLQDHGLIVSIDKCQFMVSQVTFLGHVIHEKGVSMEHDKLLAISTFPEPASKKELQSFLGMTNYYRQFIPHYSILTVPLTNLLKKNAFFQFDDSCRTTFRHLKSSFSENTFLVSPDRAKPFYLETDASSFAMGAVLHQGEPSCLRPIGFFSAKWEKAQLNYAIPDKELLAILLALRNWRRVLQGTSHPVIIKCDHQNLSRFRRHSNLSARQMRWYMELEDYHFKIDYSPGTTIKVADALSRRPDYYSRAHVAGKDCILPPSRFCSTSSILPGLSGRIPHPNEKFYWVCNYSTLQ